MNFFHEYALLIAIAIPVLTIAGYNLVLAFLGEEGTLLLPDLRPYPRVSAATRLTPADTGEVSGVPANEEFRREAA
jgi:hypothetical protein